MFIPYLKRLNLHIHEWFIWHLNYLAANYLNYVTYFPSWITRKSDIWSIEECKSEGHFYKSKKTFLLYILELESYMTIPINCSVIYSTFISAIKSSGTFIKINLIFINLPLVARHHKNSISRKILKNQNR